MTDSELTNDALHRVRGAEFDAVRRWFSPGMRVLEIGGGDGFQAGLLTRMGCIVSSIDVAPRAPADPRCPVMAYDGRNIPFPSGTFDVVFSSNVLEHVESLPGTLAELRRVERHRGLGVHLVPSSSWRFWTMVTHYPWLARRVLGRGKARHAGERDLRESARRNSNKELLWKALGLAPHGEYPNSIAELYYFSRRRWEKVFDANGFDLIHSGHNSLFYTGNGIFADMPLDVRRHLSRVLGSSCHVFVTTQRAAR